MALEPGGYADKLGNRYEGRWVVKQLLRVLNEQLASITVEAVGDDEAGVDLWVEDVSGRRFAQQCKLRNGSKNQWTIADLNGAGVLSYMQHQLDRNSETVFCLVTAIPSTLLHDICNSARASSGDSESFYQHQIVHVSLDRQKAFSSFCKYLSLDPDNSDDRAIAYGYLPRIFIEHWPDTLVSQDDLRSDAQWLVNGDADSVIANLSDYVESNLRKTISSENVWDVLDQKGFFPRTLSHDYRVLPSIRALREQFHDSISSQLIADELIEREETARSLEALKNDGIVVLHGRPGHGKSSVLYEITQHFEHNGQVFLPLRLDRQEPRNTTLQFGQDIGLPESPVKCLSAISNGEACTLILDQLDAIRWTYGHSKNALEVCKSLVREIMRLRGLGQPISVILACRTYDLENDPDIKGWLSQTAQFSENKKLTRVEVGALSDDVVASIARKLGVSSVSDRQVSILKSPQHMAMWVRLVTSGASVEFFNRIQLMRKYWDTRMQELIKTGVSSEIVTSEISRIIQYMEEKGRISAPYSISNNAPVINELCACGLIQVTSNQITFSHQSYLDFQIASNLVREIFSGNKDICDWLGGKDNQSLFRREQLRQVLSLLSEEDPEEFLIEIKKILDGENIRFNLKHLTLEVVGQIESPSNSVLQYMLSLSEVDYWKEHVFRTVFWGHSAYVSRLVESKTIERWLTTEEQKGRALWLLRSVSEKIPDKVSDLLLPYINDSAWQDRILECLNWDIDDDSEKMFQVRVQLAKNGVSRDFVNWKKVSAERAIKLLEAVLQSHEPDDFTYDNHWKLRNKRYRLENWIGDDLEILLEASRERPQDVWSLILPELIRLSPGKDEGYGTVDLWLDSDKEGLRNGRECLPNGIVKLCLEAGKELAKNNSEKFWEETKVVRQENSKVIQYLLVTIYSQLNCSLADDVLRWLISKVPHFVVGSGHQEPKWMPVARLLESMSPHCSADIFEELERRITYFREDDLLQNAKYWVSTWKEGYFGAYWGHAQYFLLPYLCKERRCKETNGLIAVLGRKFGDYDKEDFLSGIRSRGGTVSSTIPRDRVTKISDRAWLEIIGNKNIPEDGGFDCRIRGDGFVKETSVTYFSRDLECAAKRYPDRFARLALEFPEEISPKYKSAIIDALQETEPKNLSEDEIAEWSPADHELVLAVLDKFSDENEGDFPRRFCWLVYHRSEEKWPEEVVNKLIGYATSHHDPEPKKLNIGNSGGGFDSDESTTGNLESNAINCVRGVGALAITQLLWSHDELLDKVKVALECLVEDEHPAVRIASLDILLPITNFDKDYAVRLFARAVKGDFRVAASRSATRLFNSYMKSHFDQLYPIVINMLGSSQDEVVERGAHEVAARWLFHGFFSEEVESCVAGNELQRKGIAHIAAHFVGDASYFEKCKMLIDRLKGDESKEVRQELASVFRKSELFNSSQGIEFLIDFIDSSAFGDDPTLLLYRLEDYSGDLLPFANLLLAIGNHFTKPSSVSSGDNGTDTAQDIHHYMPLMVRLYEQAKDLGKPDIELMCLDIWDGMFEKQIGSVHEISRVID